MGSDQRRHARIDINIPVLVHRDEGSQPAALRNLSAGGAAIEFEPTLGKAAVSFDLRTPIDVQPRGVQPVKGRVVRSHDAGFAMQFDAVEDDLLDRIAAAERKTRG